MARGANKGTVFLATIVIVADTLRTLERLRLRGLLRGFFLVNGKLVT